jgi:hypothetical protein
MQNLNKLVIKNNENFNLEHSILFISHLPNLKNLTIPVNQLDDLPENISLLKNLEVLDLSDNQLTDLPKEMSEMDSLKVLNIEKNIFINPVKTLEKLKGLNIRYISYDPVITDKDREKLKKIFPKADIVEIVDTTDNGADLSDATGSVNTGSEEQDTASNEFTKIIVDGAHFQALSDAYLHYPVVFDRQNFKNTFDSLLFEERYMDTTYANVWKMQPWHDYDNIRLYLYKYGDKGEIWFDFHPDDKKMGVTNTSQYLSKNNPEVIAFLGMKWVYIGNLTKQQFKRKFIKTPEGIRCWIDMRIYYNERDKNFTIELKDKKGFTEITAYMRNRSTLISLEKAQESYESFYERYAKLLDSRRKRFHKRLLKDKMSYDVTLQRAVVNTWESFRRIYMSPDEKSMSMKQWLEYYDDVLADESKALYNAAPSATLFERNLVLKGFMNATNMPLLSDTSKMKGVYGIFRDDKKNSVAVMKTIVLNLSDKTFKVYEGSVGLKSIKMYFLVSSQYALIAELHNGDIGVLKSDTFSQISLHHNKEHTFILERLPRKVSTIGQIDDMLGI